MDARAHAAAGSAQRNRNQPAALRLADLPARRTRTTISAGRLALFWAAVPHQIVAWEGTAPYHVVTLPLGWFLAAGFPAAFRPAVLKGEIVSAPAAIAADEARFQQWEADLLAGESAARTGGFAGDSRAPAAPRARTPPEKPAPAPSIQNFPAPTDSPATSRATTGTADRRPRSPRPAACTRTTR